VSRDTSAYRQVAVESYLAGSVVRIRPLGGQKERKEKRKIKRKKKKGNVKESTVTNKKKFENKEKNLKEA
jgi:hypothetical protein